MSVGWTRSAEITSAIVKDVLNVLDFNSSPRSPVRMVGHSHRVRLINLNRENICLSLPVQGQIVCNT